MDKEKSIGSIWIKVKNGKEFMSGVINVKEMANVDVDMEKVRVVVFKNLYKESGDNSPDYRMYLSRPIKKDDIVPAENTELEPF